MPSPLSPLPPFGFHLVPWLSVGLWLRQSLVPCALGHEALAHLLLVKQGRVHHVTEQMPKLSCFELRKERPVRRLSAFTPHLRTRLR